MDETPDLLPLPEPPRKRSLGETILKATLFGLLVGPLPVVCVVFLAWLIGMAGGARDGIKASNQGLVESQKLAQQQARQALDIAAKAKADSLPQSPPAIAGVTSDALMQRFRTAGMPKFRLESESEPKEGQHGWRGFSSTLTEPTARELNVEVWCRWPEYSQVYSIEGTHSWYGQGELGPAHSSDVAQFYTSVINCAMREPDATAAIQWAKENMHTNATASFGAVEVQLHANVPRSRIIELRSTAR